MCYSGECKYEQYNGDCSIMMQKEGQRQWPKDSPCEVSEQYCDNCKHIDTGVSGEIHYHCKNQEYCSPSGYCDDYEQIGRDI